MKKQLHILIPVLVVAHFIHENILDAQEGKPWRAPLHVVEKLAKSQPEFNYYEEKVPDYKLPDPLVKSDGRRIEKPEEWFNSRRNEILELFRENVYGRVPATPYEMSFTVKKTDTGAMGGIATLKQVSINIRSGGKALQIRLNIFVPNKVPKPVPLFLLINNRDSAVADPTRQIKNEFWPAEEIIARGYGAAVFSNADIDPDNFDNFQNGIHGILDRGERSGNSWGTIAAWAWGASRCLDYFQTDKDINSSKIALVGHSRGGKTALWAGAEDTRFAMVIANESGCGGAAIARRRYGETIARINSAFPHWFCSNYKKYSNNEDAMPLDMHMLVSLIAPRAVYITSADEDLWADPRGSYLSLFHASPVFTLLGVRTELPQEMPPLNKPVISGKMAYHIRDGVHNLLLKDWRWFMDFADQVLK